MIRRQDILVRTVNRSEVISEPHNRKKKHPLTVNGCKSGLRSLAVLIAAMLLVSASPSGALASHSSIVRVDFGCGFGCRGRMLKAGVIERLAAISLGAFARCGQELQSPDLYLILF